jgi:hypothetical protein
MQGKTALFFMKEPHISYDTTNTQKMSREQSPFSRQPREARRSYPATARAGGGGALRQLKLPHVFCCQRFYWALHCVTVVDLRPLAGRVHFVGALKASGILRQGRPSGKSSPQG